MTNKTKSNETKSQSSEQSTFAPLGKYAVIAVLMVGVIVTTAIMLDKQLNRAETEIASIEDEISKLNDAQTKATNAPQSVTQTQGAEQATIASTTDTVITTAKIDKTAVNTVAVDSNVTNNQQSNDVAIATAEEVTSTAMAETNADSHQTRIDSHKAKQKTRMTEMFDRIAKLESKQLAQFKTRQEEQVVRLRKQVNVQQQQIDSLIQRNENLFNLRTASAQRNQAQREQMLNRI